LPADRVVIDWMISKYELVGDIMKQVM